VWDLKSAKFVKAFKPMCVGVTPLTNGTAAIRFVYKMIRLFSLWHSKPYQDIQD